MRLLRRLISMFTGGRSRTTRTHRGRRGMMSRVMSALRAFMGGGRRRTRTRI